ncbi:MAG TPA: tetratricopeptide repeat protein [Rhodanobacteraceae bacterium]
MAFAWVYELTPEGIRRTEPADSPDALSANIHHQIGRKLNALIVAVLVLAVALLAWRLIVVRHAEPTKPVQAIAAAKGKLPGAVSSASAVPTKHAPAATAIPAQIIPAKSVAVLPFENLSADKNNAYFADGIQDLILTKLADIGDLKVIARTSTQSYGSHPENLSLVGKQLGVATILEGSVQKAGNQVLINVQLIDAKTDAHIWAQSYQRTLTNIFGVEGEVSEAVAKALNAKLTVAEAARVAEVPTQNPAAYEAFLKGEYYAQQGEQQSSVADYRKAFDFYRKAVAADPRYALAWAQLARAQLEYLHFFGNEPGLATEAKTAVERALALQPQLEQAHIAQGLYRMFAQRREGIAAAAAAFAAAHALKPQDWFPIFLGGILQEDQGHWSLAIESFRNASALNPRQLPPLLETAFDYAHGGRYPQAVQILKHALAIDPGSWHATAQLAAVYALMGDLDRMQSVFEAAPAGVAATPFIVALHAQYLIYRRDWPAAHIALLNIDASTPDSPKTACLLGEVAYLSGNPGEARPYYQRCFDLATKNVASEQPGYAGLALVHLGRAKQGLALGRRDVVESGSGRMIDKVSALLLMARIEAHAGRAKDAAATLNQLFSMHGSANYVSAPLLELDPTWDPIRRDQAFRALLKKYAEDKPATADGNPPPTSGSGAIAH